MIEKDPCQESQEGGGTDSKSIAPQVTPAAVVPPPEPVVAEQQVRTELAGQAPNRHEQTPPQDSEKELSRFERRILRATWAGVVAAAITGGFIYSQFRVMSDQTQILSEQAVGAVADSIESGKRVEAQLALARDQANAAQESVKAIRRQMRQDQRAWITMLSGNVSIAEDRTVNIPVSLTDTGKTIALGMSSKFVVDIVENGKEPTLSYHNKAGMGDTAGAVFKDVPINFVATTAQIIKKTPKGVIVGPRSLTDSELLKLNSGEAFVVIYGIIKYRDVFDVPHWVHFCSFSSPSNKPVTAQKCTNYNNADNN